MNKKPWVTTEIMALYDKIRKLRRKIYTSPESTSDNQKANKEVRKNMQEAKEELIKKSMYILKHRQNDKRGKQ
ncbi:hypothetical protein DPMN_037797 [Dreissena polymorpha]|uniref:Uncharacterized protein n=1 Tax=Dreissena polymorpha TaxID=45954 RepID=A0A9D4ME23_DREPO|nr:hypothetical protein DPMN_037797 [Dreissena polymorpha]